MKSAGQGWNARNETPSPASGKPVSGAGGQPVRSRLRVFYTGKVQGVGFRYTVKNAAAGFEVTGIVRNLPDGRVELLAEGAKSELEAFQKAVRASGLRRFISGEQSSWAEAKNEFRGFEITS